MGSYVYIMYVRDGQLDMGFFHGPLASISMNMFLTYDNFVYKVYKVLFMVRSQLEERRRWIEYICCCCSATAAGRLAHISFTLPCYRLNVKTCVALKKFFFLINLDRLFSLSSSFLLHFSGLAKKTYELLRDWRGLVLSGQF